MRKMKKTLSLALALVMLLGLLPISGWQLRASAAEETVYVLDATADVEAMASNTKADGDTMTMGTDGYFTLICAAKTKIDGSSKTFSDGYSGEQRINFQSPTDVAKGMVPAIRFTTAGAATIKLWWVSGGDGRQFAIMDEAGNILTKTADESKKNSMYISELAVDDAGTYYLAVPDGPNNLFKMEVTEHVSEPAVVVNTLDATADLQPMDKGAKADGDTDVVNNYFTIIYKASTKIDGSDKTFEDGYSGSQRLNIGGKTEPDKGMIGSVMFKTASAGTVKVWWASGGDGREMALYSEAGEVLEKSTVGSVKNTPYLSEFAIPDNGTYYVGVPDGSNYIFKIEVTETSGGAVEPERTAWDAVAAPVVSSVVQNGGSLDVTVEMPIGAEGADSLTVSLLSAEGVKLKASTITSEDVVHTLSFAPVASGTYYIRAVAKRGEEAEKVAENFPAEFVLPLAVPTIVLVHNEAGGGLTAIWTESREADSYEVTCTGADGSVVTETVTGRQHTFSGLTVGQEYSITVVAIRGQERTESSAPAMAAAAEEAKIAWNFTRYGDSTNDPNNGYSVNEDGTVTVWSEGGKGKVQPDSVDGLAFYYTAVPTTHNFTLRAKVHVDSWKLSNAQEGFGLLATDRLGPNGDSTSFWNNQYMLGLTKIEYRWLEESELVLPITSSEGIKFSMKLGLGAIAKTGLTMDALAYALTMPEGFVSEKTPLDFTATKKAITGGTYNIVGNADGAVEGTLAEMTDFILEIQKNNTGYFVTYYDAEGNVISQKKHYEADALNMLDSEFVYVGFFASRNVRATYEVLEFTTIPTSEDAPAEEKPVEKIEPKVEILSADTAQSTDYELIFRANVDGTVSIRINDKNTDMKDIAVKAGQWVSLPVNVTADNITKLNVVLAPDPDQDLGEGKVLSGTGTVGATVEVTHTSAFEGRENLYVSPNGYSTGDGSLQRPLDIYTAVAVARPGQTIVLMEGTYLLEKSVKIQRGVDGTAENPIRMVADPNAETRPVLDFQRLSVGVVHYGDWWFFYGFDVTNTQNKQKGFQVAGNNNVLDNIHAYYNGDTGIQISGSSYDSAEHWPTNNLVLNCTSYCNYDAGFEDADGFAAKLTVGEGNVFDGCVAYNNADDGWDLYAKVETGPIGTVIIRNCVAYSNGFVPGVEGQGNGNGFKMGGSSISGKHQLINCYAFWNLAKGIDSNSCPDIIVENCISYNNGSYNVAFYTNIEQDTAFVASGIISFKDGEYAADGKGENLKPRGTQNESAYKNDTCYYWDGTASKNTSGAEFTGDMFLSTEFKGIARNADGTIDMQGFLALSDKAPADAGARMTGTASAVVTLNNPDQPEQPDDPVVEPTQPSTTPAEPTDPTDPADPTQPTDPTATVPDKGGIGSTVIILMLVVLGVAAVAVIVYLNKKKQK